MSVKNLPFRWRIEANGVRAVDSSPAVFDSPVRTRQGVTPVQAIMPVEGMRIPPIHPRRFETRRRRRDNEGDGYYGSRFLRLRHSNSSDAQAQVAKIVPLESHDTFRVRAKANGTC
jgi:hypothetical protein